MNFYARQAEARQQTRRLVLLFVVAVIVVVAAVDLVIVTLLSFDDAGPKFPEPGWFSSHPGVLVFTSLAVLAVIALSSLYKTAALRSGGGGVARTLGGTRVDRGMTDPLRRRLFNVVEEMAIASGVPMPEVYILEQEAGINAFAAGHSPANAAVAVTRGALEKLNRSELQGVIAHEFSHVLNGDMRLNTRMIGILFGLLVVALIGRMVLRHAPRSSGRKSGAGAVVLAALAVMLLGYVGVFFGRLIQAAVSRQRERLADASAVQFTREPQGLKGALVKIGASAEGSKLDDAKVDEVAHMLFASGMYRFFSTHPPLEERIRSLDPSFDPSEFARVRFDPPPASSAGAPAGSSTDAAMGVLAVAVNAAQVASSVGNPGTPEIAAAQAVARSLPAAVVADLDSPDRALGTLLALTLDPKTEIAQLQRRIVREQLGEGPLAAADACLAEVRALTPLQRLPVLGEVLPSLRKLPRLERTRVLACLEKLTLVDGRIEIFEYALTALARTYVFDELDPTAARAGALQLDKAAVELQAVFSTLARHGSKDEHDAVQAFEQGMRHVLPGSRHGYQPVAGWPRTLDRALKVLDRLAPPSKQLLVEALVKTIAHDGQLNVNEAELLRAICATIHCPLPPIMDTLPAS